MLPTTQLYTFLYTPTFMAFSLENDHQCDIDNGGCSYMCETDDSGIGNCICQAGFKVNKSGGCRGILCQHTLTISTTYFLYSPDINECQTNSHGCEQNCQNTQGSYQCICNEGYALHIDKKHCTSKYHYLH